MGIYSLGQHVPRIHETAWIAKSAKVIGRVAMAENSSVWFGAVVRGDVEDIRIGRNTNIQDNSVLRADSGIPLTIGENVTVGHLVMLHGCTVGDGALIGSRAVILVAPTRALKEWTGAELVPLADGRALLSFDSETSVSQFELRLLDALADPSLPDEDRETFVAVADILGNSRRSGRGEVRQRNIIVLHGVEDASQSAESA